MSLDTRTKHASEQPDVDEPIGRDHPVCGTFPSFRLVRENADSWEMKIL